MCVSSKKIEQKAVTKINDLIDKIETADSNIQKNDRTISWDGTIDFYNGTIDSKDNYEFSVDVQVKGRTKYTKKLNDKISFDLSISDLKNYLKKDGTIFFLVAFLKDTEKFNIYYLSLLPYDINKLLKEEKNHLKSVKVKMKKLKDSDDLENICRNFQLNKEIQKRMRKELFNQNNLRTSNTKFVEFSIWEKNLTSPINLIGTKQYFYAMNEDNYPIGVNIGTISKLLEKMKNMVIYDYDKEIVYTDIIKETNSNGIKISFGKAFYFDFQANTFNIKISGTFKERLKQLKFVLKAIKNKGFYINNEVILIEGALPNTFEEQINQYINFEKILEKHNITKDLKFDEWDDKDFDKINIWLSAIDDGVVLNLESNINLIGSIQIKDLRLSILAIKETENDKFKVESLWNIENHNKYHFKYSGQNKEIETNVLYLILNKEAYMSDDINIEEMKKVIKESDLKKEEYNLLNLQVLEILKAYDLNKNAKLLEYAEWLVTILIEKDKDSYEVYYINYCQILKRNGKLTEAEMVELIKIKENTNNLEVKLWCNVLLENKIEANILLKSFDEKSIELLKKYPIAKFL